MPNAATAERVYRDLTVRAFEVRAESWDDATRSFEAVLATEAPVLVMDLQRWEPVEEILVARGCKLPKKRQVPLLDSHNRFSVRDGQIGSVRDIVVADDRVTARCFISSSEAEIATKVREGHVTDCSVGYRVTNSVLIEPGQTAEVNGRTYTAGALRALRVSTEWMLKENSLCPIGADEDAKVREESAVQGRPLPTALRREGTMPEDTHAATPGAPAAPPAAPADPPVTREAPKPEVREVEEEILRRRLLAVTPHDLVPVAEAAILEGKSFEDCRAAVLAAFQTRRARPVGSTEPEAPAAAAADAPASRKVADVPDDVLKRSIVG